MSPITRRNKKTEEAVKKTSKLGPFGTFMSLFKGFVCTAILFLPASFKTGGWLFMIIMLTLSAALTIYCAFLLLEVRKHIDSTSYSDIGMRCYGVWGARAVNLTVACSQTLFCCGYVNFIVINLHEIFEASFGWDGKDKVWTGVFCFFMFSALCFVRKIEIFASTHIFANCMICLTMLYVVVEGGLELKDPKHGEFKLGGGTPVFSSTFATAIGFAIYSYEGIGIVLPVQEVTADQEAYPKIVIAVIMFVAFLYVTFGTFCISVWGNKIQALVTSNVNEEPTAPTWLNYTIKILFIFNLVFSYPLVIYPAHIIIENILYAGWEKSRKRQMTKNLTRSLLVGFTVVFTLITLDKIEKLLSFNGALFCTPVAFLFPAAFHLKVVAKDTCNKAIDIVIIIFSIGAMVFCTVMGIKEWNE